MMRSTTLHLFASVEGNRRSMQADLSAILGDPATSLKRPLHLRLFEDFTRGQILVYVNDGKAAEWTIDANDAGTNGGGFEFQPTQWSGDKEQSLSNIQVLPWDGREPALEETPSADRVFLAAGAIKTGKVTSWDGRTLKLGSDAVPRNQLTLVRFRRPPDPPEDEAPTAHVRLAGCGEFDAVRLGWRDGKFLVRTNFGGELALPPQVVTEIEFPGAETSTETGEVLVFRNGDRFRGALETADLAGSLRWRTNATEQPVNFSPTNVAGVQFGPRNSKPTGTSVVRFRNGDWLGGAFVTLDGEHLVFETVEAGRITAPRGTVKALYFGADGAPAVSDGASDHDLWQRGLALNSATRTPSKAGPGLRSPWAYGAGTYSLANALDSTFASRPGTALQLGRIFETMAARVEISFTIAAAHLPVAFNAQLFAEPNNLGYVLQMNPGGLSLYDMNARTRARGISQHQFPFGKEVKPGATVRHVRVLADRPSGRLVIFVDGVLIARFAPKAADSPRNLGRGFVLAPQAHLGPIVSNLWVGPWNGQLLEKDANSPAGIVALSNGDEVEGTVETATSTNMKIASEVGLLDLPVARITTVDLGGSPAGRNAGARLQLAGQGAITVSAWRIENATVICQSEVAGELKVPLTSVQEIIFAQPALSAAAQ